MKGILFFILFLSLTNQGFCQVLQTGLASYYNDKFEGKLTASGETYDATKMTAAHPTLPFGTRIRVTNVKNKKSVNVRVNDRGPFIKGRIVDLSKAAAIQLGFLNHGIAKVKLEVIKEDGY